MGKKQELNKVIRDKEQLDVRLKALQMHQRRLAIELESLQEKLNNQSRWEDSNFFAHVFGCFMMPWIEVEEITVVSRDERGQALGAKTNDLATAPKIHYNDHVEISRGGRREPKYKAGGAPPSRPMTLA